MASLDIFNDDAFSLTEMTKAIVNTPKLPTYAFWSSAATSRASFNRAALSGARLSAL